MRSRRAEAVIIPLLFFSVLVLLSSFDGTYPASSAAAAAGQGSPSALSLIVTLQALPADGGVYPSLMIALNDASGNPAMPLSTIKVFLSSSKLEFATVPASVDLMAGRTYVLVNVTTSQKPGKTTITAASAGLKSASTDLQTLGTGQTPDRITLSISPAKTLQSIIGNDAFVAAQLLNSSSLPAYSNATTQVFITPSNTSVVEGTMSLVIPPGKSYAFSTIKAKNPGTTSFTALSAGLTSSTASLTVLPVPFSASINASPNPMSADGISTITIAVSLEGQALPNASVTLSSNIGILNPSITTTDKTGQAYATFTSHSPGVATVAANIAHPLIGAKNVSVTVIIPESAPPVVQNPYQFAYQFIPVVVGIVIILVVVVAVRRVLRKRAASMKEEGE